MERDEHKPIKFLYPNDPHYTNEQKCNFYHEELEKLKAHQRKQRLEIKMANLKVKSEGMC